MPAGRLPEHKYSRTEATRLLCAGVYRDAGFRRQVVEELVDHRERPVAPASGVDVLPVLAHALRIVHAQTRVALAMLAVWCGFLLTDVVMAWDLLSDRWGPDADIEFHQVLDALYSGDEQLTAGMPMPWSQFYALVTLALWCADAARGSRADSFTAATGIAGAAKVVRGGIRLIGAGAGLFTLFYWFWYAAGVLGGTVRSPYPLVFPLAIALIAWWHETGQRRTVCRRLSRRTFPDAVQPGLPDTPFHNELRENIRREQEAALTLYDTDSPFVGLGSPRRPWSFALELRKREAGPGVPGARSPRPPGTAGGAVVPRQDAGPLTARAALEMIEPQLDRLRQSAARTGKDRLRELEADRFVYLPAGVGRDEPLPLGSDPDATAPASAGLSVYEPEQVAAHLAEAVDEGGEGRRVFLRIRIGAWHEQVVVTVLVRVHTQGGLLVLEVAPYVLGPVRQEFRGIDRMLDELPETWPRGAWRALRGGPATGVWAAIGAVGAVRADRAARRSGHGRAPDVPRVSLRELAGNGRLSPLQEMDATRYIKTVQERIVNGMRQALTEHSYHTDQFEQHVYQVSGGSVFIQEMSGGAVATGSHGRAGHTVQQTPRPGPDTEGSSA